MVYEVREWRWIRTRSVARNQVSLSFPPTHPLKPGAATSLPTPARPRLAGPRLWSHPGWKDVRNFLPQGKPWLSIKVSWLFFPCLCLSSTASSLTPHSSRPLVLEFFQPKSTQALMFCPGFSGPSLSHSSCDRSVSLTFFPSWQSLKR